MIRVDLGDGKYLGIFFVHNEAPKKTGARSSSICALAVNPPDRLKGYDPFNTEGTTVGISTSSASDQFCRRTGRKIALSRALANSDLDKHARYLVWQAYWVSIGEENVAGYLRKRRELGRHEFKESLKN
jgi:hypothetical protein